MQGDIHRVAVDATLRTAAPLQLSRHRRLDAQPLSDWELRKLQADPLFKPRRCRRSGTHAHERVTPHTIPLRSGHATGPAGS